MYIICPIIRVACCLRFVYWQGRPVCVSVYITLYIYTYIYIHTETETETETETDTDTHPLISMSGEYSFLTPAGERVPSNSLSYGQVYSGSMNEIGGLLMQVEQQSLQSFFVSSVVDFSQPAYVSIRQVLSK